MKTILLISLCALPLISCRPKGPAERAGENVDRAVENVKDAVDPKGPAEKTGEKLDNALGR